MWYYKGCSNFWVSRHGCLAPFLLYFGCSYLFYVHIIGPWIAWTWAPCMSQLCCCLPWELWLCIPCQWSGGFKTRQRKPSLLSKPLVEVGQISWVDLGHKRPHSHSSIWWADLAHKRPLSHSSIWWADLAHKRPDSHYSFCWADLAKKRPYSHLTAMLADLDNLIWLSNH